MVVAVVETREERAVVTRACRPWAEGLVAERHHTAEPALRDREDDVDLASNDGAEGLADT